jgi:GNAT superfamily N-acetyltransferase
VDGRDIAELAALHAACLTDSSVTALGPGYIRSFYRYIIRSDRELAFVERNESGRIVAAAVVSLEPATLNRRLLLHTSLLVGLVTHPASLLTLAFARSRGPSNHSLPELILIYTSVDERGRGHATALLEQAERRMRERNVTEYQVKTVADPANPALAFYRRRAFTPSGTSFTLGRQFQVFTRRLS